MRLGVKCITGKGCEVAKCEARQRGVRYGVRQGKGKGDRWGNGNGKEREIGKWRVKGGGERKG